MEADLTMFVGAPERSIRGHPTALSVYFVPLGHAVDGIDAPVIMHDEPRDFLPWAAATLQNLVGGSLFPGLIGYLFNDLRSLLQSGRRFRSVFARGQNQLDQLMQSLVNERVPKGRSAYHVGLIGPPNISLKEVADACTIIQKHGDTSGESDMLFWSAVHMDPWRQVSVVFSDD